MAGEFLVAGELARRGYNVSITFGNAKSVDIYAEVSPDKIRRVDAKASRYKTDFPIGTNTIIEDDVFYIFVYLHNEDQIKANEPPEYFIASGKEINESKLFHDWAGGRRGIPFKNLNTPKYLQRWDKLV